MESRRDSRPDLYPALICLAVADDVHIRFGEFDDAFLLQFLDGLDHT